MTNKDDLNQLLISVIRQLIAVIILLLVGLLIMPVIFYNSESISNLFKSKPKAITVDSVAIRSVVIFEETTFWTPQDINTLTEIKHKKLLEYGKDLIMHTAKYIGPKGSVLQISNGMNCQNCHLEAGTKVYGNNYGSVASMYPKFRARSGKVEGIYKRVNDCIERSLNGKSLDTLGHEMQAITAYIEFIGGNVEKGKKAKGSGFKDLAFLERSAEPLKGKLVYNDKCLSCHQADGLGLMNADGIEFIYPALWGNKSYNDGAGIHRLSNFAKYTKYNMPFGVTHTSTQLTDEEAWDVAAFVNSQPRPHISVPNDWPDISKKPIDYPFGPYSDKLSERQHKYGPYVPANSRK